MVKTIESINKAGYFKTIASCCGHGKYNSTIVVKDRDNNIYEYFSRQRIVKQKRHRYYMRDKQGIYFLKHLMEATGGLEPPGTRA